MVINPNQLLRRLEPSIRPTYVGGTADQPRAPIEEQGFDQMLALVSRGMVQGRPVEIGFDLEPELDESQQQRLSAAADLAEAAGARTAILLLDGRGLLLEVGGRTLTAELSVNARSPIVQLDAAVYVAGGEDEARRIPLTPGRGLPGSGLLPRGVAERLEQLTEHHHHDTSSAA
jgi:hypothetical protein